ncbi:MAG: MFS transporter [Candidatus Woesearchaeota archaeon]
MDFSRSGLNSRNIMLVYASVIAGGMLFFLPILALYYEQALFTAANVAIIFSIEAVALVIFEIPTGAVADLFGRKRTLVMANFIVMLGVIFLFIGGSMLMFALYAILNALAMALASGTYNAFLYDTLKEEGRERHYKKVIGNFYALWPLGAAIGSVAGGYMAGISLSFPVGLSLIPLMAAFMLTLFLKEPEYEKETHRNILKHVRASSGIVISSRQIMLLLAGGFILMAFGEAIHHLGPLYFKFKLIPIVWFGWITASIHILSSLGHYTSDSISEFIGNKKTVIAAVAALPLLVIISTMISGFAAIVPFVIASFFFGLRNPIIDHLLNIEVRSRNRATIVSMNSFLGQLGMAIFTPFVGWMADLYTINTAFMISAAIMLAVPVIFLFIREKDHAPHPLAPPASR